MKQLLIIALNLICLNLFAQSRLYNPTSIYDSLYTRVHLMECSLFNAAVQGKIKACKTDSLKSFFQPAELKRFAEYYTDNETINAFDPNKDSKGLCGFYKSSSSLSNPQQIFNLTSMAIMYEPFMGHTDIRLPVQPMFFIAFEDLKTFLSSSELNLITQLSNISMSDKVYGSAYSLDSLQFTMLKEFYIGPGINNEFTKFSFINKESLKAISKRIYDFSVYFILDEAQKLYHRLENEKSTKNNPLLDSLKKALITPVAITVYINPNNIYDGKDSVIMAMNLEKDFKLLEIGSTKIGIVLDNSENTKVSFTKKEFETFAPKWLVLFLFGNL